MDITPQLLKDIRLSDAFRGYNKDEVDELIERVGGAIVQLQTRLREALERAEAAEARVGAGGPRSESEETLRRTLVLAQRTADAAIAEANAQAAATLAEANEHASRTVSEANERASRLLSDTEHQASLLRSETEAEVRRVAEESRAPLMDELRELERVRGFLRDDVQVLERHVAAQREHLRAQVAELARLVDDPSALHVDPLPATSGIDVPAPAAVASTPPPREPEASAAPPPTPLPPLPPAFLTPAPVVDASAPGSDLHTGEATISYTPADIAEGARSPFAPRSEEDAESDVLDEHDALPRPPFVFEDAPGETSSTPFLDQLRRAVDDEVEPDDGPMSEFFDSDADESTRSRFGRRR